MAATRSASGGIPASGGSSSNSEENVTTLPAPGRRRVPHRLLDPLVGDADDRQIDGLGNVAQRPVATVAEHLVVPRVHRIDGASVAAALELEHHLTPDRALLDGRADHRDRTRRQHPLERRPLGTTRGAHERFLRALSFTAARYAFQPGMPLTPPPAWVADDP